MINGNSLADAAGKQVIALLLVAGVVGMALTAGLIALVVMVLT